MTKAFPQADGRTGKHLSPHPGEKYPLDSLFNTLSIPFPFSLLPWTLREGRKGGSGGYLKKGFDRFSWPIVLRGPCPG